MAAKRLRLTRWLARTWSRAKNAPKYTVWHTGLQPAASPSFQRLVTRVRKVQKRANYKLRKLAKFQLFHTGLSPAPQANAVQNISLKTHRQKKLKRKRRLSTYQLFHTGQFTLSPVNIYLKTRRAKKLVVSERRRMANFRIVWHTAAVPPVGKSNWLGVSVMSNTRRGGD